MVDALKGVLNSCPHLTPHVAFRHLELERRPEPSARNLHRADDLPRVVLEVAVVGDRLLDLPLAAHPFGREAILDAFLERRVVGTALNLLDDDEVACNVSSRVLGEEAVGQTHCADNLAAVLREELAEDRTRLVERARRCQERHHAAGTQLRERLREEVVVDLEHPGRERTVVDRHVGIRHVVDREVEEPVGELRLLETADVYALIREQSLEQFSRHGFLLHELPVDRLLVCAGCAREVASSGGRPEEPPALHAETADRFMQNAHEFDRRIESRRCGRLGGFVFLVVENLPQLLVELIRALAYSLTTQERHCAVAFSRSFEVVGAFERVAEHLLSQAAPSDELRKRSLLSRRRRVVTGFQFPDELYRVDVVADALRGVLFENRFLNRLRHDEISARGIRLRGVCGLVCALTYPRYSGRMSIPDTIRPIT